MFAVLALAGVVGAAACNQDPAAENTRKAGEAQADRLEDQADRTRDAGEARADQDKTSAEAQADRLEKQADATRDATEKRADQIEDQDRRTGTTADRTRDTAGTTGRSVDRMGAGANAAKETADIKTALMAAENIPSMDIDVDTNAAAKTVTLSGTVRTADQKAEAERIAKREAPDFKINNQLKVGAAR